MSEPATTTDLERRTPMQEVLATVASDTFMEKIAAALPEDVTPKRFISITVTAIRRTPELITAEPDSLYNAILRCAQDGLMPDGRDAALVLFKEKGVPKATYLPMIGGLRRAAADDGFTLNAHVVYENDEFDYELGAHAWVKHKPAALGEDRGKPRGAYATAIDASGQLVADPEVMSVAEIEHVRAKSRQKEGFAWTSDWPEMARKTVARRLFKSLPRGRQTSERVERVVRAMDDEFEFPDRENMTEAEANIAAGVGHLPPPAEKVEIRKEPEERPSDALLNRIARLIDEVGEAGALLTLRGVYGVDSPEQLSPEDAEAFAVKLADALDATRGDTVEGEAGLEEQTGEPVQETLVPEAEQTAFPIPEKAKQPKSRGRKS